jgi:signal transduction histidine kinase
MGSTQVPVKPASSGWELDAENIAVKIRWFGLLVGFVYVNVQGHPIDRLLLLNALLAVGAAYTLLDTWHSLRGRVFLGAYPLVVSVMEALFIGLLCRFDVGPESPFRYYYLLSLVCCAIRHPRRVTYVTCGLHCVSYGLLFLAAPPEGRAALPFVLTLVVLAWVTWAADAMGRLLKRVGDHLGRLNAALQENQAQLEARIAERTRELQEAQARLLHQEKMAAFGLLAAGIAHEVGNPLTSISSMVQMLQRRAEDPYTLDKLALVSGQLQRIRTTLRELVEFSRPASTERTRFTLAEVLDEALNIAKYYKRIRGRIAAPPLPPELPPLVGVRDQLVQALLNLILNAIDAAGRDGRVELSVTRVGHGQETMPQRGDPVPQQGLVEVAVRDDGPGVAPADVGRLFQPYFTTKKHGTGLGLFVTRRLVEEHGGTVDFESGPGGGTVFRVRLPCATAVSAMLPRPGTAEAPVAHEYAPATAEGGA